MTLSIIAAMARNRVIGRDNRLPWRLSADMARFKHLTMGHTLLMGRKTYESIGRALPGRLTIVLTRRRNFVPPGALICVAHSFEQALTLASGGELFIAGGAEVYRQLIGQAAKMYLTVIEHEFAGDAFFPQFDEAAWKLEKEERHAAAGANPYAYRFLDYVRSCPSSTGNLIPSRP